MNALQNAGIGVYYNLMNYAIMRENPEKISLVLWESADLPGAEPAGKDLSFIENRNVWT
jgi:hypothetical protein